MENTWTAYHHQADAIFTEANLASEIVGTEYDEGRIGYDLMFSLRRHIEERANRANDAAYNQARA